MKKPVKTPAQMVEEIRNLIIEIKAHYAIDINIDLCGRGTNSCEANNVAAALEKIVGAVDEVQVESRAARLETEVFGDGSDEDLEDDDIIDDDDGDDDLDDEE